MSKNCCIVIQTCDKYCEFWDSLFYYFKTNWDESIDLPIYFCNEEKDIQLPFNFKQIKTGDGTFVQNLKKILSEIKEDNLFFMLEDYWPIAPIKRDHFYKLFDFFLKENLDSLQVGPYAPYYKFEEIHRTDFIKFKQDSEWLFNFQARFWKKNVLEKCLIEPSVSESEVSSAITVEYDCDKYVKEKFNLKVYYHYYPWYPTFGGAVHRGILTEFGKQLDLFAKLDKEVNRLLKNG